MLIGGLALSVITPFLIFTIFASLGIVNYANQSEEFVKTIGKLFMSCKRNLSAHGKGS